MNSPICLHIKMLQSEKGLLFLGALLKESSRRNDAQQALLSFFDEIPSDWRLFGLALMVHVVRPCGKGRRLRRPRAPPSWAIRVANSVSSPAFARLSNLLAGPNFLNGPLGNAKRFEAAEHPAIIIIIIQQPRVASEGFHTRTPCFHYVRDKWVGRHQVRVYGWRISSAKNANESPSRCAVHLQKADALLGANNAAESCWPGVGGCKLCTVRVCGFSFLKCVALNA